MAKKKAAKRGTSRLETTDLNATPKAIALAALYIAESVLLELHSSQILSARDIQGLLNDALTALRYKEEKFGSKSYSMAREIVNCLFRQYEGRT